MEYKSENKICQNCEQDFIIEPDDFAFYEKMKVPAPTWCPECRMQRRLLFRNERFLYKRKSDFSGKEIFSMRPQEADIKVYENDVWYSDKWNPMDYGQEYDFSKSFFEQLLDLYRKVPIFALSTLYGVNSDYSNNYTGAQNCYLIFNSDYAEDCMYSVGIDNCKRCINNARIDKSENCANNFFVNSSFQIFFSIECVNSMNLWFCRDCVGCNDCVGCVGLRNKKYGIFNQQYSKEEYRAELEKLNFGSNKFIKDFSKKVYGLWIKTPVKYMRGFKNSNVSGEYINNSKNSHNVYAVFNVENMKYCNNMQTAKDCYDYSTWGAGAEMMYECTMCGIGANNIKFCIECWSEVMNLEYCLYCQSSSDLFGCVGLRSKQYCILNKQYTKEEYEALVPKIKKQMEEMPYKDAQGIEYRYGEFFPPVFSNIFYNHSFAYEYFPITKDEAKEKGYLWKEDNKRGYAFTIKSTDLPDDIKETPNSIVNEIISCEEWESSPDEAMHHNCTEVFRILPAELEFYKHFSLPVPRKCPNSRYYDLIKWRNPMKFYHRKCMKEGCNNEFETSYAPDRPEIVYCEACYNNEVA
ncbi:MAG: hypothetical protein WC711_00020 [Candidatus Staskawiczbacteria bacterium]|jgi:hypothetical protein